jgi:hypothetical protein
LEISSTLREALKHKRIIEYPTIIVTLPSNKDKYPLVQEESCNVTTNKRKSDDRNDINSTNESDERRIKRLKAEEETSTVDESSASSVSDDDTDSEEDEDEDEESEECTTTNTLALDFQHKEDENQNLLNTTHQKSSQINSETQTPAFEEEKNHPVVHKFLQLLEVFPFNWNSKELPLSVSQDLNNNIKK